MFRLINTKFTLYKSYFYSLLIFRICLFYNLNNFFKEKHFFWVFNPNFRSLSIFNWKWFIFLYLSFLSMVTSCRWNFLIFYLFHIFANWWWKLSNISRLVLNHVCLEIFNEIDYFNSWDQFQKLLNKLSLWIFLRNYFRIKKFNDEL